MFEVGIDEAGRGPVIGSLVIAGVKVNEEQIKLLKEMGVKDSKELSSIQIERMAPRVMEIVDSYKVIEIEPVEVDDAVNDPTGKLNLNWLEADKTVIIIDELNPDRAVVDCPSTVPAKYEAYLAERVKSKAKLVCEHKADANYISAAAASILAKNRREESIRELKEKHNVDFGSGYPSDPKTKAFTEKYYDKFNFFRKSWASYKNAVKSKSQTKLI